MPITHPHLLWNLRNYLEIAKSQPHVKHINSQALAIIIIIIIIITIIIVVVTIIIIIIHCTPNLSSHWLRAYS